MVTRASHLLLFLNVCLLFVINQCFLLLMLLLLLSDKETNMDRFLTIMVHLAQHGVCFLGLLLSDSAFFRAGMVQVSCQLVRRSLASHEALAPLKDLVEVVLAARHACVIQSRFK